MLDCRKNKIKMIRNEKLRLNVKICRYLTLFVRENKKKSSNFILICVLADVDLLDNKFYPNKS